MVCGFLLAAQAGVPGNKAFPVPYSHWAARVSLPPSGCRIDDQIKLHGYRIELADWTHTLGRWSSFVRAVNPHVNPLQAQVAQGRCRRSAQTGKPPPTPTCRGNQPFDVRIDGKLAGTLQVAPDTFRTLVPRRDGGRLSFSAIDDSAGLATQSRASLPARSHPTMPSRKPPA
ncbi:hypothetical protein [Achromobacter sp. Root170]|uniref:hypothetical protein n=1 Tax=Achromobacter sp. Root170 TaxID=1736480 RepID=UPI0006F76E42|nr:hypothetical protein [Achromobacter sp. Root170]KRB13171.1 hypothetical protein ASD87_09535 [Achromobacter sp. Root170]